MRLAEKFMLGFVVVMCCVLLPYGYLTYRRELDVFERDMRQDQHVLASIMALTVRDLWKNVGREAALGLVKHADRVERTDRILATWVWLDGDEGTAYRRMLTGEQLADLQRGSEVTWTDRHRDPRGRVCTVAPVTTPEGRLGAIEIRESWAEVPTYARRTMQRMLIATAVIIVVATLASAVLGFYLVGHPVRSLIDHARRIAGGDFGTCLDIRRHDELGRLSRELNAMSLQLRDAREQLLGETNQRIAAVDQLRHADRLKTVGQLASGVAHELGTPLNVVWARAKMIASGQVGPEDVPNNARIIAEQAERMTRIIKDLLGFARPRAAQRVTTDLLQIIERTTALLRSFADKRSVEMHIESREGPLSAEVDPNQLQQVLSNLILNGIQAMKDPGAVTVSLGTERITPPPDHAGPDGVYIRIAVTDKGEGISDEIMRHLFEPFFTTKQVGEGTGLGLSVSHGIVREHGGWIAVTSHRGEGSSFVVYLPRRSDDAGQRADR